MSLFCSVLDAGVFLFAGEEASGDAFLLLPAVVFGVVFAFFCVAAFFVFAVSFFAVLAMARREIVSDERSQSIVSICKDWS